MMGDNPGINYSLNRISEQANDIVYILDTYGGFDAELKHEEIGWFIEAFAESEVFYRTNQNFVYTAERNIHLRIEIGLENVSTDDDGINAEVAVTSVFVTSHPFALDGLDYDEIQDKIDHALKLA